MPVYHGNTNAGRTSRGWRDRMRPHGRMSGPRMFLAWLLFALLMVAGFVIGLVFLVLGWILLPLLRYGLFGHRARAERRDAPNVSTEHSDSQGRDGLRVIEGEYEVKDRHSADNR